MKVILLSNVKALGNQGDLVEVSDGYAQNYLLKRKLARPATKQALGEKHAHDQAQEFHLEEQRKAAAGLAEKLSGHTITVRAKAGSNGKLFGSVTAREIAQMVKSTYQIPVDKRKISVGEIKTFGRYSFTIKLMSGISADMQVEVVES